MNYKTKAATESRIWHRLCDLYLPVQNTDSIWRYSRIKHSSEPLQGWKLHISATILDACQVFEKVAPYLHTLDIQFKAPCNLTELSKINCGLQYGYTQIGKFITVYPKSEQQAISLAVELHRLTVNFNPVSIPFDRQFVSNSSVFYRYGSFIPIHQTDENGKKTLVLRNPDGNPEIDDRFQTSPVWVSDPFQKLTKFISPFNENCEEVIPDNLHIFKAITQRGKGGTYQAIDISNESPRFCIVKEGRLNGELGWNGQDGFCLVKNEYNVLTQLQTKSTCVPKVFSNFKSAGNFYLVMEYIEGKSLHSLMKWRRKRFSIRKILGFAIEILKLLNEIHKAGWIWNDCKPANIIVTKTGKLRPIDFENAFSVKDTPSFDWLSEKFTPWKKSHLREIDNRTNDYFAFGAVIYFLLTGNFFDPDNPISIMEFRKGVPFELSKIIDKLLSLDFPPQFISNEFLICEFEKIMVLLKINSKG